MVRVNEYSRDQFQFLADGRILVLTISIGHMVSLIASSALLEITNGDFTYSVFSSSSTLGHRGLRSGKLFLRSIVGWFVVGERELGWGSGVGGNGRVRCWGWGGSKRSWKLIWSMSGFEGLIG
jgi:hypothetical protein